MFVHTYIKSVGQPGKPIYGGSEFNSFLLSLDLFSPSQSQQEELPLQSVGVLSATKGLCFLLIPPSTIELPYIYCLFSGSNISYSNVHYYYCKYTRCFCYCGISLEFSCPICAGNNPHSNYHYFYGSYATLFYRYQIFLAFRSQAF